MAQKILIDMIRLREIMAERQDLVLPEAFFYPAQTRMDLKRSGNLQFSGLPAESVKMLHVWQLALLKLWRKTVKVL